MTQPELLLTEDMRLTLATSIPHVLEQQAKRNLSRWRKARGRG